MKIRLTPDKNASQLARRHSVTPTALDPKSQRDSSLPVDINNSSTIYLQMDTELSCYSNLK